MPGGGWGYKKQTNDGNLIIPPGLLLTADVRSACLSAAQRKREFKYKSAGLHYREQHKGKVSGNTVLNYTQGWQDGFEDSVKFFERSGDIIGLLGAWILKRMDDGERGKEWAEGFVAGALSFRELAGL